MVEETCSTECCGSKMGKVELVPRPSDIMKNDEDQSWLFGLHCRKCKKCPYLIVPKTLYNSQEAEFEGQDFQFLDYNSTQDILEVQSLLTTEEDGWSVANTNFKRFQAAVLNNAVYSLEEGPDQDNLESEFNLPYPQDQVWLCGSGGVIVGFALVKLKGNISGSNLFIRNKMNIIDAVYIRNLGFSSPVSKSMLGLLTSLLEHNKPWQDRIWILESDGLEFSERNLWLSQKISLV
ncbi:uncharacterized protein LOC111716067 isoform X2 [Eurytemora carolleeae]|uniref:uncharacterized protein LOC111716067 isoform X2 n=1 Tax=Eurytemora carolleeae TaxID=1294199 RepID=UPI000C7599E2|nr:uncharacterized protein LOC111716067 isoform X2 [Eurytemora carolleeae]|eukprot:XP_023347246.1 uncharacterized protein LOC111716067 isoform X2 [Eurytemora affinis]